MQITSSPATALTPTTVALGNFDGVHRGHRQVILPAICSPVAHRTYPTVVTFRPHPQEFFSGQSRQLLTLPDEKVACLAELGVEQLVILPFDRELASLTAEAFVEQILVTQLHALRVSVGQDFRFGYQRQGTALDLQTLAASHGIEVTIVPLHTWNGCRISSSAIRQALKTGELTTANQLLGRSYSLTGQVVQGRQLGRTIGFPTANLQVAPEKFLPCAGVYAVWVRGVADSKDALPGVMNIGYRPTVDGVGLTIEVHLLDWAGDLYSQTLSVSLEKFLRPEQKFTSLVDLKAQIQQDCDQAKHILTHTN